MPAFKGDVVRAVNDLNEKAAKLGWERRFRLQPGSFSNGVQHSLEEDLPCLVHPVATTKIGSSYKAALDYVNALNHALSIAVAERERARTHTLTGGEVMPGKAQPVHDPDARSVTRAREDASGGRYPQDGTVNLGHHPRQYQ